MRAWSGVTECDSCASERRDVRVRDEQAFDSVSRGTDEAAHRFELPIRAGGTGSPAPARWEEYRQGRVGAVAVRRNAIKRSCASLTV